MLLGAFGEIYLENSKEKLNKKMEMGVQICVKLNKRTDNVDIVNIVITVTEINAIKKKSRLLLRQIQSVLIARLYP